MLTLLFCLQLPPETKDEVLRALSRLNRFQVHFRQETYSDFFDETLAEGTLWVARPGKMRMDYLKGEHKTIVWDGETCFEKDFLGDTETRAPQVEVRDEPLVQLLLYGSKVDEHFLVDRVHEDDREVFRLRPRRGKGYHVEIVFTADWLPAFVEVIGEDGEGTRLWFDNYTLDPAIPLETFRIPAATRPE